MSTEPSFKSFKTALKEALKSRGFRVGRDIATMDVSDDLRVQLVVAGNEFFVAITIQVSMPRASKALSSALKSLGSRRSFNSGDVYLPIMSWDFSRDICDDKDLHESLELARWAEISASFHKLLAAFDTVCSRTELLRLMRTSLEEDRSRLGDDESAILAVGVGTTKDASLRELAELAGRRMQQSPYLSAVEKAVSDSAPALT